MNRSLKKHHAILALTICLCLHTALLIALIIVEIADPERAPIIIVADDTFDEPHQSPVSREQWMALNNSLPYAEFMHSTPEQPPHSETEANEPSPSPVETTPSVAKETAQENKQTEQFIDEAIALATQYLEEELPALAPMVEKKEQEVTQSEISHTDSEPTKEKKITLAHIAQGFMSQLQEAPMTVVSDAQGQASMEQLKQLHYCQKIIGCLVNSYKINKYNIGSHQQNNRLTVQLAINKDGSIHTLRIVESSGNSSLDQFVLSMFKDASSSFPPLPQTFKQVPFHLPFFNIDHIESFQTSQGWYIDSRRS